MPGLDPKRLFTAGDAEKAPLDGKYCFADSIESLRDRVGASFEIQELKRINSKDSFYRFVTVGNASWRMAYLMEEPPKYVPWTIENCPLRCGNILCEKYGEREFMITATDFSDGTLPIQISGSWYSLSEIFNDYVTVEGTPCGAILEGGT